MKGKTVMVTAGPTREPLDPVRFLSNRSSGKMGYSLAGEALQRGAKVILVSGPTALPPPLGAQFLAVETAAEMAEEVKRNLAAADALIMAAAVADFRPAERSREKIKKRGASRALKLVPTEDILSGLGRLSGRSKKVIVGFAAETSGLEANALKKLKEKNLDLVVANDVSREGIGFDSDFNQVLIVGRDGAAFASPAASKREISRVIMDRVEVLLGRKK